jgi:hypothetical protein
MTRRLFVSPSQLKSFVACERRWYLESQAGAPRDGDAGGQYLVYGRLVDEAVERLVANPRVVLSVDALVVAVQSARKGAELSGLTDEKWAELAEKAVRATRRLEGARLLPPTGTPAQFKYRVEVPWSPVTLVGRADYRSAGRVWDLKTTSDRGPGKGPSGEKPPNALTDATLREDFQARVYAAAEFFAQPTLASVSMRWVYTSSTTQAVWTATAFFTRAETLAWFDANVRGPIFPRMIELAATEGLAVDEARANHDGCARCFIKGACSPFSGAQQHGTELVNMDLERLRARRAGAINRPASPVAPTDDDLVTPLRASLTAEIAAASGGTVDDRRADVAPSEAPAVALREAMAEDAETSAALRRNAEYVATGLPAALQAATESAPAAKRGRGRPRKPRSATLAVEDTIEAELDRAGLKLVEAALVPSSRPPTAAELERIAALDAAAASVSETRQQLVHTALALVDAASAARNALRAAGVRFEGDPS